MSKRLDLPSAILAGFSILYPFIAVTTVRFAGPGVAIVVVIAILLARLAIPALRGLPAPLALPAVLIAVAGVAAFDRQLSVRLYPVFMNVAMLVAFASTLWNPPSMAERFARMSEPDLPEVAVRYTRKVTMVWVGFFALNGAIALWSVLQPGWTAWLLYNGGIAYAAAGLLFGAEYLVRLRVRGRGAP